MIEIADQQKSIALPRRKVRRLAEAVLGGEGVRMALSLAFVGDARIRRINRRFLRHDWATDVISFPLGEDEGEVVISTEYAAREAGKRGIPVGEELLRYVAHGILHLLGYDDTTPAKKRAMWRRQEAYVRSVTRRA